MDLGRQMSRTNHSRGSRENQRLFNDLPLHLYSRYTDSNDFLTRSRRPNSTDLNTRLYTTSTLPRFTSVSSYYPASAPTSPVPPYSREWRVPPPPVTVSSTKSGVTARPVSAGASVSLASPISPVSPRSTSPYSTRSPSPRYESRVPSRPVSPQYTPTSVYDRSPLPPPPPPRYSSYQLSLPVSPPTPPPPPSAPPPPPPRLYSYIPTTSQHTSRSPTIKSVSERLLDLEAEETASSIARLPDSHEISAQGNMLANDLDRSVSRSENFIRQIEEKLQGLGHKVEHPPVSANKKDTTPSSVNEKCDSSTEERRSPSPNKEYVGWRQRVASVYEVEIKDEKQLLDVINEREKSFNDAPDKASGEENINLISLLIAPETEIRKRRESNRDAKESRKQSDHHSVPASSGTCVSSCFEVTSAYEEMRKEKASNAKVDKHTWTIKEYLPHILGAILLLWIVVSLMMSGKKVAKKTIVSQVREEGLAARSITVGPAIPTTLRPEIARQTKAKKKSPTTLAPATTDAPKATAAAKTTAPSKAASTASTVVKTVTPDTTTGQKTTGKTTEVPKKSTPATTVASKTTAATLTTRKVKKERPPAQEGIIDKTEEKRAESTGGKVKSNNVPMDKVRERVSAASTMTPLLDEKSLNKATKVVKKAIKECEDKFEVSSGKIKKMIEKTVKYDEKVSKVGKSDKLTIDSKKNVNNKEATSAIKADAKVAEVEKKVKVKRVQVSGNSSSTQVNEMTSNGTRNEGQKRMKKNSTMSPEEITVNTSPERKSKKSKSDKVDDGKQQAQVEIINATLSGAGEMSASVKKKKKKSPTNATMEVGAKSRVQKNLNVTDTKSSGKLKVN